MSPVSLYKVATSPSLFQIPELFPQYGLVAASVSSPEKSRTSEHERHAGFLRAQVHT